MDAIPPGLQIGGLAGILALLILAVVKEWIIPGPAHRREVDDVRAQRDKAQDGNAHALGIVAMQAEALQEFAHKEDLAVRAVEAIREHANEKRGEH